MSDISKHSPQRSLFVFYLLFVEHFLLRVVIFYGEPLVTYRGSSFWIDVEQTFPVFFSGLFCSEFISLPGALSAGAPVGYPRSLCAKLRASSQKHVTCGIIDPSVDICLLRAQFCWDFELASHCLQWVSGEKFSVF